MKPLNQWARYYGYNDFDTYMRAGGALHVARVDILNRIQILQTALNALANLAPAEPPTREPDKPIVIPDDVAEDETLDPDNAHVQGAECG